MYRQALLAGLKVAARRPTNLTKVYDLRQGLEESPAAFSERIMDAFCQNTPINTEKPENLGMVALAYINQLAPDIKKQLQKIERLGEKTA